MQDKASKSGASKVRIDDDWRNRVQLVLMVFRVVVLNHDFDYATATAIVNFTTTYDAGIQPNPAHSME